MFTKTGKKQVTLFAHCLNVYSRKLKKIQTNRCKSELSEVSGYKVIIQRTIVFLCISYEQWENAKKIPFTIVVKTPNT